VLYTYFEQHGWHHLSETCVFHQLLEYYIYRKELRKEALKDLEQCHLVIKYNLKNLNFNFTGFKMLIL